VQCELLTVKIEEEAMVKETRDEMRRWEDVSQEYEEQWRQHGYLGMRWEDIMPGYRYGYEMAYDSRYEGRRWNDVKSELASGYRTWAEGYGYRSDGHDLWDQIKHSVREAWENVTAQKRAS
jgi:hypothetical protein